MCTCLDKTSLSHLISDAWRFGQQVLQAHNKFRSIHTAPALRLDNQLTHDAQQYAEYLAKRGTLEHVRDAEYGENLAMKCMAPQEKDPTGQFFTTLW